MLYIGFLTDNRTGENVQRRPFLLDYLYIVHKPCPFVSADANFFDLSITYSARRVMLFDLLAECSDYVIKQSVVG